MKIRNLKANNISGISYDIDQNSSVGIGGLSGSGKSTFCSTVYSESIRRIISLLPKSEYRFLFSDCLETNCSASLIEELPLVFYLKKNGFSSNPRSTIGTHSGLFKKVRMMFAQKYHLSTEYFSFNNSLMWCPDCKGRGSSAGNECKTCNGSRYNQEILKYTISINGNEKNIVDINQMTIEELRYYSDSLNFDTLDIETLDNLINLGLSYLSMDRIMSTLSGGETIRVLLSEFMALCEGALFILDEVSTGLDKDSLITVLKETAKLAKKNQVWFIDHSDTVLYSTNKQIYFGPGSGENGGTIVDDSPRPAPVFPIVKHESSCDWYTFHKLSKRNIQIDTLSIPKNRITSITGESGCGKSTLVNECIIPNFKKAYKSASLIIIGQDRNQSITSKSTIASFLDIKKYITKKGDNPTNISLNQACTVYKKDKHIYPIINMLVELGLGYLTLDRKVQTLSTGEFQCVHLIAKLFQLEKTEMLIVLDEPSKGLSQNILNLFMNRMRTILSEYNATILVIEHNDYVLKCSDYIIDFGKRQKNNVTMLSVTPIEQWSNKSENELQIKVPNSQNNTKSGLSYVTENVDEIYHTYETSFKGGLLKNFSSTAQWIYKDYTVSKIRPVIAIDFEKQLYSENTFVFEICSIINNIVSLSNLVQPEKFDFYNPDNLCECCKGTGTINTFDYSSMIVDSSVGLWDGMLHPDIMKELKRYNYTKIKLLFKEIKKESGLDLSKPLSSMNETEKNTFLYGYWKNTFYDPNKNTQRRWYGILHLISKYLRSSTSKFKEVIKSSSSRITCPECNGLLIKHSNQMLFKSKGIKDILNSTIGEACVLFDTIPQLKDIKQILGNNIVLLDDISNVPYDKQVQLKTLEIAYSNLYGYEIALKNFAPYYSQNKGLIDRIAKNNNVILCDWDNIEQTKDELLSIISKKKIKSSSYVYEIMGYKKISTLINQVRKNNCCPFCNGTGMLRDESIFEGVDVTKTPCSACNENGINEKGLQEIIEGYTVATWISGVVSDVNSTAPDCIKSIPLFVKISELNKKQLKSIIEYLGG